MLRCHRIHGMMQPQCGQTMHLHLLQVLEVRWERILAVPQWYGYRHRMGDLADSYLIGWKDWKWVFEWDWVFEQDWTSHLVACPPANTNKTASWYCDTVWHVLWLTFSVPSNDNVSLYLLCIQEHWLNNHSCSICDNQHRHKYYALNTARLSMYNIPPGPFHLFSALLHGFPVDITQILKDSSRLTGILG